MVLSWHWPRNAACYHQEQWKGQVTGHFFRFSRKRLGWNKSCELGSKCRFFDLSRCLGSCVGVAFSPGWATTAHSQCEVLVLGEVICAIETWCKGYLSGAGVALRSVVPCGDFSVSLLLCISLADLSCSGCVASLLGLTCVCGGSA